MYKIVKVAKDGKTLEHSNAIATEARAIKLCAIQNWIAVENGTRYALRIVKA